MGYINFKICLSVPFNKTPQVDSMTWRLHDIGRSQMFDQGKQCMGNTRYQSNVWIVEGGAPDPPSLQTLPAVAPLILKILPHKGASTHPHDRKTSTLRNIQLYKEALVTPWSDCHA